MKVLVHKNTDITKIISIQTKSQREHLIQAQMYSDQVLAIRNAELEAINQEHRRTIRLKGLNK